MEIANPATHIYLARHASPDWSRRDLVYYLPPGPPLTDQGRLEAEALGQFLQQQQVGRLLVSPLERCQVTAEIAGQISQAQTETLPELIEWSPEENKDMIRARCRAALKAAEAAAEKGPVAVISHGGPIGMMLTELGMDPVTLERWCVYDHRNPLPPAGVWEARRFSRQEPWQLHLVFTPQVDHRA